MREKGRFGGPFPLGSLPLVRDFRPAYTRRAQCYRRHPVLFRRPGRRSSAVLDRPPQQGRAASDTRGSSDPRPAGGRDGGEMRADTSAKPSATACCCLMPPARADVTQTSALARRLPPVQPSAGGSGPQAGLGWRAACEQARQLNEAEGNPGEAGRSVAVSCRCFYAPAALRPADCRRLQPDQ